MSPTRIRWLIVAAVLGSFLWFFAPVLFQDRALGFRDAANYYYPLFEWECREWRAGRVPLWNPLDNAGTPVLADATSSVLYPGKLIFALPTSFRLRYHLYVTGHVLLAAAGAYALARAWQSSVTGAGLAALAYAFGGSVVAQTCNVVFLVGAAWFPWAILAAERMRRLRSDRWAMVLGAVLALMTLGGDPQASYQAGLLAALYVWLSGPIRASATEGTSILVRGARLRLLTVAAGSGLALAAVQIVPSIQWALVSDRTATDQPHNVYEAARMALGPTTLTDVAASLFSDPARGTHAANVYEFSVGPWHMAELFWPNCFGRNVPRNERWVTALPGEGRTWSPSMYMGLLPVLLAMRSWRLRGGEAASRFSTWLTVIGLCGSFGWYGIGWLLNEVYLSCAGEASTHLSIGKPVGGLYWLLVMFLPGFAYFRYPAKFLVVAALGFSMLAAQGWDRCPEDPAPRRPKAVWVLAGISMALAIVLWLCQPLWTHWLQQAPVDALFGPLQITAATHGLYLSLLHALCVAVVCGWLLRGSGSKGTRNDKLAGMALLLTALDLCLANGWLAPTINGRILRQPQSVAIAIHADAGHSGTLPLRFYRAPIAAFVPRAWSESASPSRLEEVVQWERELLLPTHHHSAATPMAAAHTTLSSRDWNAMLHVARDHAARDLSADSYALFSPLAVAYLGLPAETQLDGYEKVSTETVAGMTLWHDPQAYPRAWLVHQALQLEPLRTTTSTDVLQRTREVMLSDGQPRDLRAIVVLESDEPLPPLPASSLPSASERCQIVHDDPLQTKIHAHVEQPAYLVLADTFHAGWQAERITAGTRIPLTIYRANRTFRAVYLPAGEHTVIFSYRPFYFYFAALVSTGVCLSIAVSVMLRLRHTRSSARPGMFFSQR